MQTKDRDYEEAQSEIMRDEREKPALNIYNEEANGGRWWEKTC